MAVAASYVTVGRSCRAVPRAVALAVALAATFAALAWQLKLHLAPQFEGFLNWGTPKWMVSEGKFHEKIDDLGVPPISGTPHFNGLI